MSDARNVVELVPEAEATVAETVAKPLRAPKAPNVGDSVEKWERWIAKCEAYMKEKGLYHRPVESFAAFKEKDIQRYGTNWATAVRWGDDKRYLKNMEVSWKWRTYIHLKGRPPLFSDSQRYSYR